MNIEVNWFNAEKTILTWTFNGQWDWDEYAEAQNVSNSMIASVKHTVHLLWDFRQTKDLPEGLIFGYKKNIQHQSRQLGIIVIVGATFYITEMFGHLSSVLSEEQQRFRFRQSPEEAQYLIEMEYMEPMR